MLLPPPGADNNAEIVTYLDGLMTETSIRRAQYDLQADANYDLYMGRQWATAAINGVARVTVNRILNSVLAQAAILTETSPYCQLVPRESNEPPVYFLHLEGTPITAVILDAIKGIPEEAQGPTMGPDGERIPKRPLTEEEAGQIKDALFQGAQIALGVEAGTTDPAEMANIVPPTILASVDNQTCAEALQIIFDAKWEEANTDFVLVENFTNNLIVGWQWMLYEWDDSLQQHRLRNPVHLQVNCDPVATDVSNARYVMYDQLFSADEACALFPELATQIREYARPGVPNPPSQYNYRQASNYSNITYTRDMIIVRTAWIRDQFYPMEAELAMAKGLVTLAIQQIQQEDGQTVEQAVYMANGKETHPGDSQWPKRPGVRQIQVVVNTVIRDQECELGDIPMPYNVNIPIPYQIQGMGEPERLEGMQRAVNAIISDWVAFYNNHAFPIEYIPASVNDFNPMIKNSAYIHAGAKFTVPDDLLVALGGKIAGYIEPPPFPQQGPELLQLLLDLIDKESNHAEVLQGQAKAGWSGEAIGALQRAASGVIGFKSRRAMRMIEHLGKLMLRAIVNRTTAADWKRYLPGHDIEVLDAMRERIKGIQSNIAIKVTSGGKSDGPMEQQSLIQANQAHLVSPQTALKKMGYNPQVEEQNWKKWEKINAPPMPPTPPPGSTPPPQK